MDNGFPRLGAQEDLGLVLKWWETSIPFCTQRLKVISDPRIGSSLSNFQTAAGELFDQHMKRISTLWSQAAKVTNKHKGKNVSLSTWTFFTFVTVVFGITRKYLNTHKQEDKTFLKYFQSYHPSEDKVNSLTVTHASMYTLTLTHRL